MRLSFNGMKVKASVIVWLWFSLVLTGETFPLPEMANPNTIQVDENQAYFTDGPMVYIYNLKDFKLKKKFGKIGEGPGEFLEAPGTGAPPLYLDILSDKISVYSIGKITFFTKDGQYINEIKTKDQSRRFKKFGNGFVGNLNMVIDNVRCRTVNLYDQELNKIKMLASMPHSLQGQGGGFNPLEGTQTYSVYKDRLFVCWGPDFKIHVFDTSGNEINTITQPFQKRKVTREDKKKIEDYLKSLPRVKEIYRFLAPLRFPEYFPALRIMMTADGKVYAITRQDERNRSQCFIFSLDGTLIKKMFIDLKSVDQLALYPFTIKGSKVYQLVEDEEEEEWTVEVRALNF